MNAVKEISKLNDLVSTSKKTGGKITFISGDYKTETEKLIKKICPYSKVGLVGFSKTYQSYGKEIVDELKKTGSKTVSLIMPDKYSDSVDYASLLFNFPEDVRLLIVFDRELMRSCTYFSGIRNVPILYIPKDFFFYKSLDDVLFFRNGGKTEKIICRSNKYVLFDENFISCDGLEMVYAHIVSKIVALFDYKIYKTIKGERANKTVISTALSIIKETIDIMNVKIEERGKFLAINALKIELMNFITGAELFSYSAEVFTGKLLASKSDFYSIELASAIKILAYYSDFFSAKEAFPVFPNYNKRVEEVSYVLRLSEKELADAFIKHTDDFFKNKSLYFKTIDSLKDSAKRAFDVVANLKSTYLTLGGKEYFGLDEDQLYDAVRFSGDVPFYFNGMTVLRELGILD